MYKYDIKNDEWEDTNRPMQETRSYHSCLLLNKQILAAGGFGTKTTEIFSLQSNMWRSGPDLPRKIYSFQLVKARPSSQYAAFLIGGGYYDEVYSDIYGLTKDLNSFIKLGDLKTSRFSHVAMELPDKVIEKCVDF